MYIISARITKNLLENLPKDLKSVYDKVSDVAKQHDVDAYLVGGAVRDLLLEVQPKDIDFMVKGEAEKDRFVKLLLKNIDGARSATDIGKSFLIDIINIDGNMIDISPAVKDLPPAPGTRNRGVEPTDDLQKDAERRDFSINALFYDVRKDKLIDLVGGLKDIKSRVLKPTIPKNEDILIEQDPLRIFRAVRFASTKGLKIDPSLQTAIKKNLKSILERKISPERIKGEFDKIFEGKNAAYGLELIKDLGLFSYIYPTHDKLGIADWNLDQNNKHHKLNVLDHSIQVLKNFETFVNKNKDQLSYANDPKLLRLYKMAAFFHDIGKLDKGLHGKNKEGYTTYYGHEDSSTALVEQIMSHLRYSNDDTDLVKHMVKNHMHAHRMIDSYEEGKLSDKAVRKFIRNTGDHFKATVDIAHADASGKDIDMVLEYHPYQGFKDKADAIGIEKTKNIKPILNGNQIQKEYNKSPGPWIGKIEDFQIQILEGNPDTTEEEMLDLIKKHFPKDWVDKQSNISKRIKYAANEHVINLPSQFKDPLLRLFNIAEKLGLNLYMVGGIVRDMVLGYPPSHDLDILIGERDGDKKMAEYIKVHYPDMHVVQSPKSKYPLMVIQMGPIKVDMTTPHTVERQNDTIIIKDSDLIADSKKRDFGVNSLFYDVKNKKILDLSGNGINDIKNNVLRLQLPPHLTFALSPKTILKAIRLATTRGFELDENLVKDIKNNINYLHYIDSKSFKKELDKILYSKNSKRGLDLMKDTGILDYIKTYKEEFDVDDIMLDENSPFHNPIAKGAKNLSKRIKYSQTSTTPYYKGECPESGAKVYFTPSTLVRNKGKIDCPEGPRKPKNIKPSSLADRILSKRYKKNKKKKKKSHKKKSSHSKISKSACIECVEHAAKNDLTAREYKEYYQEQHPESQYKPVYMPVNTKKKNKQPAHMQNSPLGHEMSFDERREIMYPKYDVNYENYSGYDEVSEMNRSEDNMHSFPGDSGI